MVSYTYRNGMYLTMLDGRVEEAHADLVDFLDSLADFPDRYARRVW